MMSGIRLVLFAILSGILSGLSQPFVVSIFSEKELLNPIFSGFLAWVSYIPIFYISRGLEPKKAFWLGTIGGIAYFGIVLYWLDIAMTVFGNMPQYLAIPVLFVLVIYCALYWGFWGYISTYISRSVGIDLSIVSPFVFVTLEYIRNYLLSGFPWGNIAYSQYKNIIFIQISALGGIYLVQYVVLLINSVLECWFRFFVDRKEKRPLRYSVVLLLVLSFVYLYGLIRANSVDTEMSNSKKVKASLLQGNIDQGIKKRSSEYRGTILSNYLDLIEKASGFNPDIVVWPEAAFPLSLPDEMSSFSNKDRLLNADSFPFGQIVGVSTYSYSQGKRLLHNGAFILDENLDVVGKYYKSHLVPFGEYVPLGIPVEKFVSGVGTFVPGEEVKPVEISHNDNRIKAGILICYEGIFPEISREHSKKGANLLVNLTNDAWYGISSAPYQHLSMYVFRAIENGKFVLRAANTGVSAFINPYGKITAQTGIFERGILNGEISLMEGRTIYTSIGDVFAILCLLFTFGMIVLSKAIQRKRV